MEKIKSADTNLNGSSRSTWPSLELVNNFSTDVMFVVQLLSHVWLFVTPWTNCSMPGSSVLYYILEFAQIHVHWISDSIYLILCHPLLLLPSVLPNIRVFSNESALCITWPKYWSFSFNNIQGWFPLGLTGLISLQSKGLSRVFSSTIIWKHQFFGTQPLWSNSHICTWLLEKP